MYQREGFRRVTYLAARFSRTLPGRVKAVESHWMSASRAQGFEQYATVIHLTTILGRCFLTLERILHEGTLRDASL